MTTGQKILIFIIAIAVILVAVCYKFNEYKNNKQSIETNTNQVNSVYNQYIYN